jgi:hypothetical protein
MSDYVGAKGRLFEMLDEDVDKGMTKTAVLNADDPASAALRSRTKARPLTTAPGPADLRAGIARLDGLRVFDIVGAFGRQAVRLPLPGATASTTPSPPLRRRFRSESRRRSSPPGLAADSGVPGRME